jgi:hypothetical protein
MSRQFAMDLQHAAFTHIEFQQRLEGMDAALGHHAPIPIQPMQDLH